MKNGVLMLRGGQFLKYLVRFILGCVVLGVLWAAFVIWAAWIYGTCDTAAENADAIVVLGCHVYPGGVPSPALYARTEHSLGLYKKGRAPGILLCGGLGDNPPAESVVMKKLLLEWGVPEEAIITEAVSRSTVEQAREAARILLPEKGRIIVVSDFFHVWRASYLFRAEGFTVARRPALESPLYQWRSKAYYYTFRESLSLAKLFRLQWGAALTLWLVLSILWTRRSIRKRTLERT
jgi:uncharacterized SAM-binding protein YcdF (DUF218 family)